MALAWQEARQLGDGHLGTEHTAKISNLYLLLKGGLERELGNAGTAWLWRNERRANRSYDRADGRRYYRPDAELLLYPPLSPDALLDALPQPFHLFIEVQTASSHKSSSEIASKVAEHRLATTLTSFPPGSDVSWSSPARRTRTSRPRKTPPPATTSP